VCRIAGIYNPNSENLEGEILRMRDAMHRGGPDDAGIFIHDSLPMALGHRRLSLLDLSSAGHQPMAINGGNLQMVYNGEIYNFYELRKELENLGHSFRTQTDSEVILYSYLEWGKSCFERFNGMFALAIWDEQKQEIVLARDQTGIKPLYYYIDEEVLIFASEVRAFEALSAKWQSSEVWEPLLLMFGHLPEPFTTLKGVKTLSKGTWMCIHAPSLNYKSAVFADQDYTPKIFEKAKAIEAIRDILPAAVKRHLISDAPIGVFLSGGIDSSLLTLLAAPLMKEKLTTLSIEFEDTKYSEEVYQKMVVDITGATHKAFKVSQAGFETHLEDILAAMDQPSLDGINTYFVSMHAKQCGLKAVLSGLGADELFGGYPSFSRFDQWRYLSYVPRFISKMVGKSTNSSLSKLSYEQFHPMLSLYLVNRGLYTAEMASVYTGIGLNEIEAALAEIDIPPSIDYRSSNANVAMELTLYMKNQLLKDSDYMGMWHGLEIRVPFLDNELVQAINSIAPDVKFRSAIPKSLLIEAFSNLLPAEIWQRKKQGFTFPFANWLKTSTQLVPQGKIEHRVFDQFNSEKVHWSRYWAFKVIGMGKFRKNSYQLADSGR